MKCLRPASCSARFGALTRDTAGAAHNTSLGLAALCDFLLGLAFEFVLLGPFTWDPLERQFGKYRQSAGGNYLITARSTAERRRTDKARLLGKLNVDALFVKYAVAFHATAPAP